MQKVISSMILLFAFCGLTQKELIGQTLNPKVTVMFEQSIESIEPTMPNIDPLFKYHLRDIAICRGPGGKYYLTGTTPLSGSEKEGYMTVLIGDASIDFINSVPVDEPSFGMKLLNK